MDRHFSRRMFLHKIQRRADWKISQRQKISEEMGNLVEEKQLLNDLVDHMKKLKINL